MSVFDYFEQISEPFNTLIAAIKSGQSSEVGEALTQIVQKSEEDPNIFGSGSYSEALTVAIRKGNPDIFKQLCVFGASRLTTFDFMESRSVVQQLKNHDDAQFRQIFLWFLNDCAKGVQAALTFALYIQDYTTLIVDQICKDATYVNLRCTLARCAIEFNDIDLVWSIVQTTPQAIPHLNECDPNTDKGRAWIEIDERYTVWKSQQEHDILTAEVSGMDKHTTARKM